MGLPLGERNSIISSGKENEVYHWKHRIQLFPVVKEKIITTGFIKNGIYSGKLKNIYH